MSMRSPLLMSDGSFSQSSVGSSCRILWCFCLIIMGFIHCPHLYSLCPCRMCNFPRLILGCCNNQLLFVLFHVSVIFFFYCSVIFLYHHCCIFIFINVIVDFFYHLHYHHSYYLHRHSAPYLPQSFLNKSTQLGRVLTRDDTNLLWGDSVCLPARPC